MADLDALSSHLAAAIPGFGALREIKKFPDGQSNPTYKLIAESGTYVLRRKPDGPLLKSAHAIDREYKVLHALSSSKVPVPKTLYYCHDPEVFGTEFYVVSFLGGRVFWDPRLPDMSNDQRGRIYDAQNQTLVDLHDVDVAEVGLLDFGKPGAYFSRQLGRWVQQYRATETELIPEMDQLIAALEAFDMSDDGMVSLVHGDFRIDNLMFAKDSEKVIGVMDWELSTLGHPVSDLAYQCMQWRLPVGALTKGLGDLDRRAFGIPTEQEYLDTYCQRRDLPGIENWTFCLAFSFFRLAAILQGVRKRALDGNASSQQAMEVSSLVRPLARQGLETFLEQRSIS